MCDNTAAREDSPDSQLDLGSPCIGDSKKRATFEKNSFDIHASFLL